ncbi:MAG: hypothetical protein IAG13_05705 [Deltaproteobacteria bacterium]|nr:hypothetical protein [Nannocystaceae bacterium]
MGEAVSVVPHRSGAVVVAYVTQDEHRLELVDAQGEASWTTSWPRGADDDGLAALAVDETGDIYVAALGGSASVWAFVSPQ